MSVVILTLDEEVNIGACLDSCAWARDVHLLDSGSRDGTREIARERGVRVWEHPFESFGAQRNWAIDHIPVAHDWVFHLDADERFTPALVEEVARVLATHPAEAGYLIASQMIFMNTWIKRSSGYPVYQMRLFHKARMRFADHGHGQREVADGPVGTLASPYIHHNFSKGLNDWFDRHNKYSTLEARQIIADGPARAGGLSGLFSGDRLARRRALKNLAASLPMRPSLRWVYTALIQLGFLDGRAGLTYAQLLAMYERMIQIKVRALRAENPHHP